MNRELKKLPNVRPGGAALSCHPLGKLRLKDPKSVQDSPRLVNEFKISLGNLFCLKIKALKEGQVCLSGRL